MFNFWGVYRYTCGRDFFRVFVLVLMGETWVLGSSNLIHLGVDTFEPCKSLLGGVFSEYFGRDLLM